MKTYSRSLAEDERLGVQEALPAGRASYDKDERSRLARMVTRLFEHWGVDTSAQAELLGLSGGSRTAVSRYRRGTPLPESRDLIDRVGNLFGIHKSLRLLYPHNPELVYGWPSLRNATLDNYTPLEIMVEQGLPGIVAIRGYLDQLRGL
ncbi:antitoxin Xre-like helix-turn-helix domain-containing protein [Hydrocarboniphaga sp.]|uniref:antitoxin Xre-like helix-turn-helix domain-containing protein n=1 Tax=Hydrocarboniphaga sp. TaxID=2033016 RepID=UPI003D0BB986